MGSAGVFGNIGRLRRRGVVCCRGVFLVWQPKRAALDEHRLPSGHGAEQLAGASSCDWVPSPALGRQAALSLSFEMIRLFGVYLG